MGAGDRIFSKEQLERGICNKVSATKGEIKRYTVAIKRDSNKEQCENRENWKIERQVNECDKAACTSSSRLIYYW